MVPSIVHFCFGMTPDFGGRPFSLVHYLSVRSAWEKLKPDCILMHCAHEPTGEWWELAKPMVQVHRVAPVNGIYGFPAAHPAHRADIIRLAALQAMGGIYLDTDVLVLRSFVPLMEAEFVAARELTAAGVHVGLSNAILLAKPNSRFGQLCLEGHDPRKSLWQGFRSRGRDEHYVEYSVRYPCLLADLAPGLLNALPSRSFLWATWDEAGLKKLFADDVAVPDDVYAIHLWESHAWVKHLSALTPELIYSKDTTFNRLARPFLPESHGIESSTKGDGVDPQALERMDAICREADFVDPHHQLAGNLGERVKRWMRLSARHFRDEMTLPLRCRIDELDQRTALHLQVQGPPSTSVVSAEWVAGGEVPRFGALDGSDKLLGQFLPRGVVSFVAFTGDEGEPAVVSWLTTHTANHGVWATSSLRRANQLAEWAGATGLALRAILAPAPAEAPPTTEQRILRGSTVLILADLSNYQERWSQFCQAPPQIVMICGRDRADDRGNLGKFATDHGYRLAGESSDKTFQVFVNDSVSNEPLVPSLESRVRTLYGQVIHVSKHSDQV